MSKARKVKTRLDLVPDLIPCIRQTSEESQPVPDEPVLRFSARPACCCCVAVRDDEHAADSEEDRDEVHHADEAGGAGRGWGWEVIERQEVGPLCIASGEIAREQRMSAG